MKNGQLGDYLLWKGEPSKIVAEIQNRAVVIVPLNNEPCKCCGQQRDAVIIVGSPLYQENAEPMQTIENNPTLTIH